MEYLSNFSCDSVSGDECVELHRQSSIMIEPIVQCEGLPRRLWNTKSVTLMNDMGLEVAKGLCQSVNCDMISGATVPLGDTHVGVQISMSLSEDDVPDEWRYSIRAWPIKLAYYKGASLYDHEQQDKFNAIIAARQNPIQRGTVRPYTTLLRRPPTQVSTKVTKLLSPESVNLVSSEVCCKKNCVQPFPREKIRMLRERMYLLTGYEFKNHLKLEVHRQIHGGADGKKVVTLDGIGVCLSAWRHIMGVSETTYYRYAAYAAEGRRAEKHGNSGLKKPRQHTVQASATLQCLLDKCADHMPHKTKTLSSGEKVVSKILPASWTWKDSLPHLNGVNKSFGLKEVSTSNLSKIRKVCFPEYDAKRPGDNFARCSICDRYHSLERSAVTGSQAQILWTLKLNEHLAAQWAHRKLYYINRYRSAEFPLECVTIIHDKMDHAKTASPLFSHRTKCLDGLMKLPVSVTGMIAHGQGDVRYAHYGLDIFSHDANYTVGSFAKLLRDLELPPKSTSRELFTGSGSSPLFQALLEGSETCKSSLSPAPQTPLPAVPLPPILNVQMDNAASDNKNRFVFCFWSLLVAKGIFREVYVNFMLVGHTHDDVDALFGRWSMELKKNNYPTIPLLMKSFMDAETIPVIPHLIEEVPDFKGFIEGYIAEGAETLEGHSKAQAFKFYVDSNGYPMMKYKIYCTDNDWLPKGSVGIKLWREDNDGKAMMPHGQPDALVPEPMKNLNEIVRGLSGFITYWNNMSNEDSTGEYRRRFEHLSHYWNNVRQTLLLPMVDQTELQDGFWPTTRFAPALEDQFTENGNVREEYGVDDHFVGQRQDRPDQSFRVAKDLFEGYFVAIRPSDDNTRPVWIGREMSDPNCSCEHANCVLIQYFEPTSHLAEVRNNYTGWNSEQGLKWKMDETQEEVWLHTDHIMTSWKPRIRNDFRNCTISIPVAQRNIIEESIARILEVES